MNDITRFFMTTASNKIMEIVVICIVMDTIFGVLRAIKEKKFNSNFGINGAIRKVGMLISLVLLALVDSIIRLNLIGFIPAGAEHIFRDRQSERWSFSHCYILHMR